MKIASTVPSARKGPNGTWVFRPPPPTLMTITPMTDPIKNDRNIPRSTSPGARQVAEERTQDEGQLHVSPAHPRGIDERHEEEEATEDRGPQSRSQQAARIAVDQGGDGQQRPSGPERRVDHPVRKQLVLEVDRGQNHEHPEER